MTESKAVTKPVLKPKFDGPQAVMQTPRQLRSQMDRDTEIRAIVTEFIKNAMVEGKDFGSIEVKKGTGIMSKPSLFKPGAEKFCGLFKIRPTFKRDNETVEMLGNTPGILAYICELVDSQGRVIGEGRGTAKTDPNGLDFDINKQVKIAQKRAQVDAVLRTGGLSDFFTQDMEDAPRESAPPKKATEKQINWLRNVASEYGTEMESADEIDDWIEKVIGYRPDQLSIRAVSQAVKKIEAAIAQEKQAKQSDEPIDLDAITDLSEEEVAEGIKNLDNIPY